MWALIPLVTILNAPVGFDMTEADPKSGFAFETKPLCEGFIKEHFSKVPETITWVSPRREVIQLKVQQKFICIPIYTTDPGS